MLGVKPVGRVLGNLDSSKTTLALPEKGLKLLATRAPLMTGLPETKDVPELENTIPERFRFPASATPPLESMLPTSTLVFPSAVICVAL